MEGIMAVAPVHEARMARSSPSTSRPGTAAVWQMVGDEVKLDGEELIIMKEADIMGIIAN